MKFKPQLFISAAFVALVLPLLFAAGIASGMYQQDGTIQTGSSPVAYSNPSDGICVTGLNRDGSMVINTSINNNRDCVSYTNGLTGLQAVNVTAQNICGTAMNGPCTSSTLCTRPDGKVSWNSTLLQCLDVSACTFATANSPKHAWSTSVCVDSSGNGISLVNLDNDSTMCVSKGGTIATGGACVAYGWLYQNSKVGETVPYRSGTLANPYKGRVAGDQLGFCYTSMRMTTAYSSMLTCPSINNTSLYCTGGTNAGKACTVATQATDCPGTGGGTCTANALNGGWQLGTDATYYQSQTSYDAGLGWSWNTTGPQCLYAYGVTGYLANNLIKVDGSYPQVDSVTGSFTSITSGVSALAGIYADLSTLTTQGDCLANGGSWDNWLPIGNGLGGGGNAKILNSTTTPTGPATTPNASTIVKLDATTSVANGGGKFSSGTGGVCTKCHTDMSRGYMERNKTGFVSTGHKLAADNNNGFPNIGNLWGLHGVQCTMCHATAKPGQQDVAGLIIYPGGTYAGLPRSASGHNQTEYGSHATGVCFNCHGTMANPTTLNPATNIPVQGTDFKNNTNTGLAPIGNQFLNSPHAKFFTAGSQSTTLSVITKTNYLSLFLGKVCRSSSTLGGGNILTTVYRSGNAVEIPTASDSCVGGNCVNAACTNPGDGSPTSGAAGFWVSEGEASTSTSVSSDQGNCTTCHDVHWSLDVKGSGDPIRRKCTSCHGDTTSVPNAANINLRKINHKSGDGTPLSYALTDPDGACQVCHMPRLSSNGSAMHLMRISTDPTYKTIASGSLANVDANGYAWVDLNTSCGQCHGGDNGTPITVNGTQIPRFTAAQLAPVAAAMHAGTVEQPFAPASQANFSTSYGADSMTINVSAMMNSCNGGCTSYEWDWGEIDPSTGQPVPHTFGVSSSHTYFTPGTKAINLGITAADGSVITGSKTVNAYAPDTPPTVSGCGGSILSASTWVATCTDTSTDNPGGGVAQVTVNWGDGSMLSTGPQGGTFTHTYLNPGTYTVTHKAVDTIGQISTEYNTVTVSTFSISGVVQTAPEPVLNFGIANATVRLTKGSTSVTVYTDSTGAFSAGNLKPGGYSVTVTKSGYTFPVVPTQTVGGSVTGLTITAATSPSVTTVPVPVAYTPTGTGISATPTFTFSAVYGSVGYVLTMQDCTGVSAPALCPAVSGSPFTITPAAAGCSSGSGTCSYLWPNGTTFTSGRTYQWNVAAQEGSVGQGSASNTLTFTVQ